MVLLSACNPLLDIVAEVPRELLQQFDLPFGGAVLAAEKQIELFSKIPKDFECSFLAGGCGQNTVRVYQALCGNKPGESMFLGSIGNDKEGEQLKELLESQGIETLYKVCEGEPTGSCLVLVTDKERSVCTRLGAATKINFEFLKSVFEKVQKADAVYCTGFLLSSSTEVAIELSRHCGATGKVFAFNLSASFLFEIYKNEIKEVLKNTSILIGNKEEATAFAASCGIDCSGSMGDVALQLLQLLLQLQQQQQTEEDAKEALEKAKDSKKDAKDGKEELLENENSKVKINSFFKAVVITQGPDAVIVASTDTTPPPSSSSSSSSSKLRVSSYPTPEVPAEEIKDLNGAGDAFAGGFLFGALALGCTYTAAQLGSWCAAQVIRRSGFQFQIQNCPFLPNLNFKKENKSQKSENKSPEIPQSPPETSFSENAKKFQVQQLPFN